MATYGKKKRAIFPSFPVFRDQPDNRSTYTQLGVDGPTGNVESKRQILGPKTTNGKSVIATAKRALTARFGSPSTKPLNRTLSAIENESVGQRYGGSRSQPSHLPIYESMRTRRETPEPPTDDENPFSDKVSGLRQHPTDEWFSSSPVGFSTPRVRLEPVSDATGKKRLSAVPIPDPSLPDFDFEQEMTDDETDPLIHDWKGPDCSTNAKRKSATEDPQGFACKRAKTGLVFSRETKIPAQGSGQLGNNRLDCMDGKMDKEESIESGSFGVPNISNVREAETWTRRRAKTSSNARYGRPRTSSMSTSSSVLFSRETRARVPLIETDNDDEMDTDELQMDDIEILDGNTG
ncbi:MAG: hypothetical protein Q9202_001651 [Teloschistes flavicans]